MPLQAGTSLGPYQIEAPLGAGGMGEVYKAIDTRLDRTVAIKVLPEHVASDPDLKQRFEREARTVAALNHPHICTLYDIGTQDGINFLVMEYLDGQTVAQRLEKGALPLDQALQVAIEIADALDKAHRQGIVHRDLKPANIMLTKAGAKLLDFGLAKLKPADQVGGLSAMATQSAGLTGEGKILGTLQYMAPEQLEGKDVDARTDIFAFGATVYEMVTGQKAFTGESQASLIGAILKDEPQPISTLQSISPPALDRLVDTCLAKDPDDRWQSARDVGREIGWMAENDSGASKLVQGLGVSRSVVSRQGVPLALAALVVGGMITGIGVWSVTRTPPPAVARYRVTPLHAFSQRNIALTPDGGRMVYRGGRDAPHFFVRPLVGLEATPLLEGLDENPSLPFVSPDGTSVGYVGRPGVLKRVSILGGPPVTICDCRAPGGASWGTDDRIIFARQFGDNAGLWRVAADGGDPEPLTTLDDNLGQRSHAWPDILPGGEAVLFTIVPDGPIENAQIALLTLESGDYRVLIPGSYPRYVSTGHIVYAMGGSLWAVAFDIDQGALVGAPVPVVEDVIMYSDGEAFFAVTRDGGSLVYASGETTSGGRSLVWVDRQGQEQFLELTPGLDYHAPRVSPDGTRAAFHYPEPDSGGGMDMWVFEFGRRTSRRLTSAPTYNGIPNWTPDGERLAFLHREATRQLFWALVRGC